MELKNIYQKDLEKIRKEFHLKFELPKVPNFSPTILATAWHDDWYGYNFREITKDDIVLDIGAETGLFSLLAAKMGAKVYAMEALSPQWVSDNIQKNNLSDKIKLLSFAFGPNNKIECSHHFQGPILAEMLSHDLEWIFDNVNDKITVIKCDCEGYEWPGFKNTTDFRNVRKIDMEAHILDNDQTEMHNLIQRMKKDGFSVEYSSPPHNKGITLTVISARKK